MTSFLAARPRRPLRLLQPRRPLRWLTRAALCAGCLQQALAAGTTAAAGGRTDFPLRTAVAPLRQSASHLAAPALAAAGLQTVPTAPRLELRPASARDALPFGAMRLQLSGQSTLLLRPRGGGLSVSLRSQF